MRRLFAAGLVAIACAPRVFAQSTTSTTCWNGVAYMSCTSTTEQDRHPIADFMKALQDIEARDEQQKALNARIAFYKEQARRLAATRFTDSVAAYNAAIARDEAAKLRADNLWALYEPRAALVMKQAIDSMHLFDSTATRFWTESGNVLVRLFAADSQASNATMADAISPNVAAYQSALRLSGKLSIAIANYLADSLASRKLGRDSVRDALLGRLIILEGFTLSADSTAMRAWVGPTVDSIGAARKRARRRAP